MRFLMHYGSVLKRKMEIQHWYVNWVQNETITLCYSLLPSEDLNNTTMGINWSEKNYPESKG